METIQHSMLFHVYRKTNISICVLKGTTDGFHRLIIVPMQTPYTNGLPHSPFLLLLLLYRLIRSPSLSFLRQRWASIHNVTDELVSMNRKWIHLVLAVCNFSLRRSVIFCRASKTESIPNRYWYHHDWFSMTNRRPIIIVYCCKETQQLFYWVQIAHEIVAVVVLEMGR